MVYIEIINNIFDVGKLINICNDMSNVNFSKVLPILLTINNNDIINYIFTKCNDDTILKNKLEHLLYSNPYIKNLNQINSNIYNDFLNICNKIKTNYLDGKEIILENNLYHPLSQNKINKIVMLKQFKTINKPILIDFKPNDIKLLIKHGEDMKQEVGIINMFNIINEIFANNIKNKEYRPYLHTYEIISVEKNWGLIEYIDNCIDLVYHEKTNYANIKNYNKFITSLAGTMLISYVLGIKDRHYENILVTNDDILFHIDFDFILGTVPPGINMYKIPLSSKLYKFLVKINKWDLFIEIMINGFFCLRQENKILLRSIIIFFENKNINHCEKFVRKRLLLKYNNDKAKKKFINMLRHAPLCLHNKIKLNIMPLFKKFVDKFPDKTKYHTKKSLEKDPSKNKDNDMIHMYKVKKNKKIY